MKTFLQLLAVMTLMLGVAQHADAAKKFGSGGFGKTYSSPSQTQPARPDPIQQKQAQPQQQQQAQPAANQSSSKKGLLGGMLGGLLAGGLFAWMLGSGAFDGIQMMDILLIVGVGLLIFMLLRRKRGSAEPQPAYSGASAGGYEQPQQHSQQDSRPDFMARDNVADSTGSHSTGSHSAAAHTDQDNSSNLSSMMRTGSQAPMNLPADFDTVAFIGSALQHYREVQQAWNDGNMEKIRGYVASDLYQQLASQRAEMEQEPPRTEIIDLAADIVRADQDGAIRQISVLFRGRCRDLLEQSEDGIFDTWHLERDMSKDNAPWLIVGVEAE